jgi:hypothetical protein
MYSPSTVPNWIVIIYEGQQRFDKVAADQMTSNFVKSCGATGTATSHILSAFHPHQAS